ncbi:MAG: LVIVD repeat-containing protein [Gemmatimonadaceae bacterium]
MKFESFSRRPEWRLATAPLSSLFVSIALLSAAACASSSSRPAGGVSTSSPGSDPRVGLRAGWMDAGEAIWNLAIVAKRQPSEAFINLSTPGDRRLTNSDLAFRGNFVIQGNYSGYQVWDISEPRNPTLRTAYVCPGSQGDVSVYRHLMFMSAEDLRGRIDCGMQGVPDTVSKERLRGIRIFDITDIAHPRLVASVQTCRGSHTHTVVTDPNDSDNVYIYVSGNAAVRSHHELQGCSGKQAEEDSNTALFRIEVIRVPVAAPEQAKIVSSPRIFTGLGTVMTHLDTGTNLQPGSQVTQCHDITVYPAIGLAGGACAGYGLLLDIRDAANPRRIGEVSDPNFSFWHSATFSNDGSKILFTDEWGGGRAPKCRSTDKPEWGANAIFTLVDGKMTFVSYYKLPAPQTSFENCVAHNGSLIPIPGRDIMVQAWYQGGISVFDWTDPAHPREIAYFDRGPMDATKLVSGGYWSVYWYNGYIVGSEMSRGLDLFQLKPSAFLSQNEIDAAELVHFDYLNAQEQPKLVWAASFVVARAYLDQLVRGNGLSSDRSSAIAIDLNSAEKLRGDERRTALTRLATQLDGDARAATDSTRVQALAAIVRELARLE